MKVAVLIFPVMIVFAASRRSKSTTSHSGMELKPVKADKYEESVVSKLIIQHDSTGELIGPAVPATNWAVGMRNDDDNMVIAFRCASRILVACVFMTLAAHFGQEGYQIGSPFQIIPDSPEMRAKGLKSFSSVDLVMASLETLTSNTSRRGLLPLILSFLSNSCAALIASLFWLDPSLCEGYTSLVGGAIIFVQLSLALSKLQSHYR